MEITQHLNSASEQKLYTSMIVHTSQQGIVSTCLPCSSPKIEHTTLYLKLSPAPLCVAL